MTDEEKIAALMESAKRAFADMNTLTPDMLKDLQSGNYANMVMYAETLKRLIRQVNALFEVVLPETMPKEYAGYTYAWMQQLEFLLFVHVDIVAAALEKKQ